MDNQRVYNMSFASLYPHYIHKVQKKGYSKEDLDLIIFWLTGYNQEDLLKIIHNKTTLRDFFNQAPDFNNMAHTITGVICGHRVEQIKDPLMQKIRYLDKLVDELARGKKMEKILRQ
ncbi:DUF2200 domain-containing protein [Myroides sp. LJL119]